MTRRPKAICDASGFACHVDDLVKQWDGAMVLPRFLDRRQPQDFVRAVPERAPPVTRPETPDAFIIAQVRPEDL